ncbi:hypothetical protein [Streptomyces sp. NPDC057939]|uniref:hypothetical protein n=1 Tax=Streptomyces sp. NPDC057939 TaxID=3346284 RepID=UPI0036E08624
MYRARPAGEPAAFAARISRREEPGERLSRSDADAAAAESAAGRRVFLAMTHAGAAPAGASGASYRPCPGPAEVSDSFARVSAGDLVAELG